MWTLFYNHWRRVLLILIRETGASYFSRVRFGCACATVGIKFRGARGGEGWTQGPAQHARRTTAPPELCSGVQSGDSVTERPGGPRAVGEHETTTLIKTSPGLARSTMGMIFGRISEETPRFEVVKAAPDLPYQIRAYQPSVVAEVRCEFCVGSISYA
eukprot:SAG31_NODE_3996_length_3679_cov_1.092179_4_plen_158_part_00